MDPGALAQAFQQARPELVIHAAAMAKTKDCRLDPGRARRINTEATAQLAGLAADKGARLLYVSTDLVFDGAKGTYSELDAPAPLSIYGQSKHDAEQNVLKHPHSMVARVNWLFGPTLTGSPGFFDYMLADLRGNSPLTLFNDEWRSPISMAVAAKALVSIALSDFAGMIHLGGPERMSRLDIGQRLAVYLGVVAPSIQVSSRTSDSVEEPRPRDTSFDSTKWRSLFPDERWPRFEEALQELIPR
jgi:dTDP-4-dehydrorhamnose reductase